MNLKGWNSQAHRELPGKFESSNLSRDTGRTGVYETNIPPKQSAHWSFGSHGTKSGAGEQSLPLDCRARARPKGVFFHRHRYGCMFAASHKAALTTAQRNVARLDEVNCICPLLLGEVHRQRPLHEAQASGPRPRPALDGCPLTVFQKGGSEKGDTEDNYLKVT